MKILTAAALLVAALGLAACETVKGVGEDLGKAGKGITNASENVQKKL